MRWGQVVWPGGDHASLPTTADPDPGQRPGHGALYPCSTHNVIHRLQETVDEVDVWVEWYGGSASGAGRPLVVQPYGSAYIGGTSTPPTVGNGYLAVVDIPATMLLRGLTFRVGVAGTGTVQWGLFDFTDDPTACSKVAGGSAAMNSTGWVTIAAASAPVTVGAGTYVVIFQGPATNAPSIATSASVAAAKLQKLQTSWTWDDTPDLSTGWTDTATGWLMYLLGDLDGSTQW